MSGVILLWAESWSRSLSGSSFTSLFAPSGHAHKEYTSFPLKGHAALRIMVLFSVFIYT